MTTWTAAELQRIGDADELHVASLRKDGTLRKYVIIWVVRSGDELYIRSAGGTERPWFRLAKASGEGRIQAGGVERDVTFAEAAADAHAGIDAVFHTKYDHYGAVDVDPVVGEIAAKATFRLVPRD